MGEKIIRKNMWSKKIKDRNEIRMAVKMKQLTHQEELGTEKVIHRWILPPTKNEGKKTFRY